jgi:ADP-heptose:LPS heptosyltransferase
MNSALKALITPALQNTSATDDELNISQVAFENHHAQVFHLWLHSDEKKQVALASDRYIFFSICQCAGSHINYIRSINAEAPRQFASYLCNLVRQLEMTTKSFTEEWYKGLNLLVDACISQHFVQEARDIVAICVRTGVTKYPGIAQTSLLHGAYLDFLIGRKDKAAKNAIQLMQQPYLLPNRRELPKLYYQFMHILAARNHLAEYRQIIWRGVSNLYTEDKLRDVFVAQISKTYRGTLRAIFFSDAAIASRLSFFIGQIAKLIDQVELLKILKIGKLFRLIHKGYMAALNLSRLTYFAPVGSASLPIKGLVVPKKWKLKQKRILVTRAMGGIGDIIMMTPGLLAMKQRYPKAQIDFAVPQSFHALLSGLKEINVLDINVTPIDMPSYSRWVNLTDCPAGRAEAKQYPNVKANRIESFAKAMRISKLYLRMTQGFKPFYAVTTDERRRAIEYLNQLNPSQLPVIAIQPYSVDTYKNWPYMEELAVALSKDHCVLIFHHENVPGYGSTNIHKILMPIRKSIALLAQATQLVAVDSSFVHLAAALDIKTLAIFGPTSGRVFTRHYPTVSYIAPSKQEFPCNPCWRNEHKPCHLTNGRESICLRSIESSFVAERIKLQKPKPSVLPIIKRISSWIQYGTE